MEPLSLLIRWAHVVGMAAILGGALLVWWLTVRPPPMNRGSDARLEVAQRYEWIFWIAIGVQAMTGVGNLGAFGQHIPAPTTPWGARLTVKLVAVLALAVVSVPRTLAIGAALGVRRPPAPGRSQVVPILYAGTVVAVLVIVALAVWLAHG